MFRIIYFLITLLISGMAFTSFAEEVRILSWWGYFDDPEVTKTIETACNVKIHIDEYYTNDEFLRREEEANYDIYIYSDTASLITKRRLENNTVDLSNTINNYNKSVKNHYLSENRKTNTLIFSISASILVLLDNKNPISKTTSLLDLLKNNKKDGLILMEDPLEFYTLLEYGLTRLEKNLLGGTSEQFYNIGYLLTKSNIMVSNSINVIPDTYPFSLAHVWSGEAFAYKWKQNNLRTIKGDNIQNTPSNYNYIINPKFTHLSKDLISLQSHSASNDCVATQLSHQETHSKILANTHYLSPFIKTDLTHMNVLQSNLDTYRWKIIPNIKHYKKIHQHWNDLRFHLLKNQQKVSENNL